ncbi:MAG TPA: class I SAM-dependent methyltransferase, partial [Actinomycetota bacterium]|nr:class I SAM-dependent methyltransferase [Actinomycetota bacterium]
DDVRAYWDRSASSYDRGIRLFERLLSIEDARRWVASRASGDVLEVGLGTGLNLPFYAPSVRLTAVDLSPAMLARAERRAAEIARDVELRLGDAEALDFADGRFDTVVFGLCLCSIPDDRRAVAEGARVLKPGGRMVVLEHVRSPSRIVRAGQRILEPVTIRLLADHLLREPLELLQAEGLRIEELHRWGWGFMERASARKPA